MAGSPTHHRGMRALAALCYRRRGTVVIIWVVALVVLGALGGIFGGATKTNFSIPGAESQEAIDFLEQRGFADRSGQQGLVVVQADQGIDDPQVRAATEKLLKDIEAAVPGTSAASFYEPGAERQIAPGRKIAYAELNFADRSGEEYLDAGKEVKSLRNAVHVPGMRVELESTGSTAKLDNIQGMMDVSQGLKPDGTFTIGAVAEGDYKVRLRGLPADGYTVEVRQGTEGVTDVGINVTATPPLPLEIIVRR